MTDKLCMIPYSDIEFDKTYTNISEYFLRGNESVKALLTGLGTEDRIVRGECSDFELLRVFLKKCQVEKAYQSAVSKTFVGVVKKLIGEDTPFSLDAETVWAGTSKALLDNKLRQQLASVSLECLGVPILPNEYFDEHFSAVKGVSLVPVACPCGTQNVSFETFGENKSFGDVCKTVFDSISVADSCAVFTSDFVFEKPNEYTAAKAYEKYLCGYNLLNKEKAILESQLLRVTALAASERGRELMIFLPFAPHVRSMGAVAEFIDYLDENVLENKIKLSVFGGDAVGLCMAASIVGKGYKNITAVTGICGNGSDMPDIGSAKYWGAGASALENYASLAKTSALLPSR